jgi:hypothetical protein
MSTRQKRRLLVARCMFELAGSVGNPATSAPVLLRKVNAMLRLQRRKPTTAKQLESVAAHINRFIKVYQAA